jgi:hypothetical protein
MASTKKRSRQERGLKIQEALVETHTTSISTEKDETIIKKLKKKLERAVSCVENTRKAMGRG